MLIVVFLNVMPTVAMASVEGQKASAFSSLKKVKTINKTLQLKLAMGTANLANHLA
jgi:hypothetical protein